MSCGCGGGGFGAQLSQDRLTLTRGRDFQAKLTSKDQRSGVLVPFPAGEFFFELDTEPVKTVWPFSVGDDPAVAVCEVQSTAAALVPERTKFQLVFLPEGEAEGGFPVALGVVRWQG